MDFDYLIIYWWFLTLIPLRWFIAVGRCGSLANSSTYSLHCFLNRSFASFSTRRVFIEIIENLLLGRFNDNMVIIEFWHSADHTDLAIFFVIIVFVFARNQFFGTSAWSYLYLKIQPICETWIYIVVLIKVYEIFVRKVLSLYSRRGLSYWNIFVVDLKHFQIWKESE